MDKIALIIATKDRPQELKRLLNSLEEQTAKVDQVIIIDSSQPGRKEPFDRKGLKSLKIDYFTFDFPSTSKQRNFGMTKVAEGISWVGFVDDDVILEKTAIEEMKKAIWDLREDERVVGLGFNMVNHPPLEFQGLKKLFLVEKIGFYHRQKGVVLPSGFQTLIGFVSQNVEVEWLPSTAVIWKKDRIINHFFDEKFSGYGYLEDLDFSYPLGKKYKLLVIASAKYHHLPAKSGRGRPVCFGRREVLNRLYFVRKHKDLSLLRCYLALFVRFKMSLFLGLKKADPQYWLRAIGNIWGLFESIFLLQIRH